MPGDHEGVLYAEADLRLAFRGRFIHDFAGHYNRSDIYRLTIFQHGSDDLVQYASDRERGDSTGEPGPTQARQMEGIDRLEHLSGEEAHEAPVFEDVNAPPQLGRARNG